MLYFAAEIVTNFFKTINEYNFPYCLMRNLQNELPDSLEKGKDIDILIPYQNKDDFGNYLRANGFQNKNHPLKNDIFLYNTYPFEMYENNLGLLIDVNYSLSVRSLNRGEWIPLHKKIQEKAFEDLRIHSNGKIQYNTLSFEIELISLITRCIFDYNHFPKRYRNRITELIKCVEHDLLIYLLELIFFRYSKYLYDLLIKMEYDIIFESYLKFKDY